ncbi:hypothetical protein MBLNU457_1591t1 [Dothideomycetes sp. NU457]
MTSPPASPEYTSPSKVLSPVSPKPLYYPQPANIPVLEKQIDPAFNQTAIHMSSTGTEPAKSGGVPLQGRSEPTESTAEEIRQGIQDGSTQDNEVEMEGTDTQETAKDSEPQNVSAASAQALPSEPLETQSTSQASIDPSLQTTQTNDLSEPPTETIVISQNLDIPQSDQPPALSGDATTSQPAIEGGIDYQKLLDSLSSVPQVPQPQDTATSLPSQPPAPGTVEATAAAAAGLPPRPPPQAQPAIHPNYTQSDDIRDYHPHAQNPATNQSQANGNGAQMYSAPTYAPGTTPSAGNGLPPPPLASFQAAPPDQMPSPRTQAFQRSILKSERERKLAAGEILTDDETPWTHETQRLYEAFLDEERQFVQEGNWEQFPYGSRLFVGNLSSERVTKRDIFHVFHHYGRIAQISIKQAYGFVQFFDIASCDKATRAENGRIIRGKKVNLEISKPQKNSKHFDPRRRSRSPDTGRAPAGIDRYVSVPGRRNDRNDRDRERDRGRRDYRPGRSPSPPHGIRSRDRSPERYERFRSRSRSPYGRGHRRNGSDDNDLPLPRRQPRDVPDVQILVLDQLDRNFVQWVEQSFISAGVRADVLIFSPRLNEAAVIRRQIIEGVVAVCKLGISNQQASLVPLQVFDRRGGADIRFEEYADLAPKIAAQVVLRAKASNPAPSYGYGYGSGAPPPPVQPIPGNPQLSNLISSMDSNTLQKLLGVVQHSPTTSQAPQQPALPTDLARLLAGGGAPVQSPYGQPAPAQDPLAMLRNNPALAGLLNGQGSPAQQAPGSLPPPQQQGGQPNMADILARLNSYKR